MSLVLCRARVWNDGQGGQCLNPRPQGGGDLCEVHQRQALSTRGLTYGLVDGPIPDSKLSDFLGAAEDALAQAAVVVAPEKRGRGRPRKVQSATEEGGATADAG